MAPSAVACYFLTALPHCLIGTTLWLNLACSYVQNLRQTNYTDKEGGEMELIRASEDSVLKQRTGSHGI